MNISVNHRQEKNDSLPSAPAQSSLPRRPFEFAREESASGRADDAAIGRTKKRPAPVIITAAGDDDTTRFELRRRTKKRPAPVITAGGDDDDTTRFELRRRSNNDEATSSSAAPAQAQIAPPPFPLLRRRVTSSMENLRGAIARAGFCASSIALPSIDADDDGNCTTGEPRRRRSVAVTCSPPPSTPTATIATNSHRKRELSRSAPLGFAPPPAAPERRRRVLDLSLRLSPPLLLANGGGAPTPSSSIGLPSAPSPPLLLAAMHTHGEKKTASKGSSEEAEERATGRGVEFRVGPRFDSPWLAQLRPPVVPKQVEVSASQSS